MLQCKRRPKECKELSEKEREFMLECRRRLRECKELSKKEREFSEPKGGWGKLNYIRIGH